MFFYTKSLKPHPFSIKELRFFHESAILRKIPVLCRLRTDFYFITNSTSTRNTVDRRGLLARGDPESWPCSSLLYQNVNINIFIDSIYNHSLIMPERKNTDFVFHNLKINCQSKVFFQGSRLPWPHKEVFHISLNSGEAFTCIICVKWIWKILWWASRKSKVMEISKHTYKYKMYPTLILKIAIPNIFLYGQLRQ